MNDDPDTSSRMLVLAPGHGLQITPMRLKEMKPYEVEIENRFSYISAGTELRGIANYRKMKEGSVPPHPIGYSQCGVVTRVGSEIGTVRPGDRVVAIGNGAMHASKIVVARNLVMPLPEAVRSEVASMMAMCCFCLQGVLRVRPRPGQNVLVLGAGVMGQISARLYHMMGCRVWVMDSNHYRLGFLPPEIAAISPDEAGWAALRQAVLPYGVEVAAVCFGGDATDAMESLREVMSRSADGIAQGDIIFTGGASVRLMMASHMGNIRLLSSAKAGAGYRDPVYESGQDYPLAYVPHTVRRNMETVLELMGDGRLGGLERLITHRFAFADAEEAYKMLEAPQARAMAVVLDHGCLG